MAHSSPEHEPNVEPRKSETLYFDDKLKELLPGIEFEEPTEMLEARRVILEALTTNSQDVHLIQRIWAGYADICEQTVDNAPNNDPQTRAQLQIAMIIHKALIFREIGNITRYNEELNSAETYAYHMYFDEVAKAIATEQHKIANLK